MKYDDALTLIGRVVKQESKLKGLNLDNVDWSADKWLVLYLNILKHIECAKEGR